MASPFLRIEQSQFKAKPRKFISEDSLLIHAEQDFLGINKQIQKSNYIFASSNFSKNTFIKREHKSTFRHISVLSPRLKFGDFSKDK